MSADEKSLSEGKTIAGKLLPAIENEPASLGDENTRTDKAGSQQSSDSVQIRDVSDRYKVERLIGQGGMGEVSLAMDLKLNRKVAIKRIRGQSVDSQIALRRFMTEAQAIAQLNHYHIVNVYDFGHDQNGPYLILEYVSGGTLAEKLKSGPLSLEQSIDMTCQLCDGLAQAHAAGIIHRDIKPANILLTPEGYPKLTDFGLARQELSDSGHTKTGAIIGTIDFMSPEQRRDSSQTDARSDIWSLGATLYQMVTGKSPRIIRFDTVPKSLQEVLGKAIEDNKEERYQFVRDFKDALKSTKTSKHVLQTHLGQGVCVNCGTQNDKDRKFCRGCGGDLRVPCLSCDTSIPAWEDFCGNCGANLPQLLETYRIRMESEKSEAESLLKRNDFEGATKLTSKVLDISDFRLRHLSIWAEEFLIKIENAREEQIEFIRELLSESTVYENKYEYTSAIKVLEQVPEGLRDILISGEQNNIRYQAERLREIVKVIDNLEKEIRSQVKNKNLAGLLVKVDRLLALQPQRIEVRDLKEKLLDRENKLSKKRNELLSEVKNQMQLCDYDSALQLISRMDESYVNQSEIINIKNDAVKKRDRLKILKSEISSDIRAKQYQGLIPKIEEVLHLNPKDEEVKDIGKWIKEINSKHVKEKAQVLSKAQALKAACQFRSAVELLNNMPENQISDGSRELSAICTELMIMRQETIGTIKNAMLADDYSAAIYASKDYMRKISEEMLYDKEINDLQRQCQSLIRDQMAVQSSPVLQRKSHVNQSNDEQVFTVGSAVNLTLAMLTCFLIANVIVVFLFF